MNNKQSGIIQAYLIVLITLAAIIGTGYYIMRRSHPKSPISTQIPEAVTQESPCESKLIAGSVIFDIAQPAPFADPRVNEIRKNINANYLSWRDGSIIKIDGKDYSSGKYFANVEVGSEASAVTILKSNPSVTYASQNMSLCPTRPKVKVE